MTPQPFVRFAAVTAAVVCAMLLDGCKGPSTPTGQPVTSKATPNAIYTLTCANWLNASKETADQELGPLYAAFVHDLLQNPELVQPGGAIQGPVHAELNATTIPAARKYVTEKVCGTQFGSANLAATVFTFFLQAPSLPPGIVAGRE